MHGPTEAASGVFKDGHAAEFDVVFKEGQFAAGEWLRDASRFGVAAGLGWRWCQGGFDGFVEGSPR